MNNALLIVSDVLKELHTNGRVTIKSDPDGEYFASEVADIVEGVLIDLKAPYSGIQVSEAEYKLELN